MSCALWVACRSDWLLTFRERLWAATERYPVPVLLAIGARGDTDAEEGALADAALA